MYVQSYSYMYEKNQIMTLNAANDFVCFSFVLVTEKKLNAGNILYTFNFLQDE